MSTQKIKKTFSIVELLAVITVMSILIGIVAAAMKPDPVNSAARELSGVINKARSYAISKRKFTVVHIILKDNYAQVEPIEYFDSNAGLYTADTSKKGTIPGSTTTYLNKGASVRSNTDITNNGFYISFRPDGGVNLTTPNGSSDYTAATIFDINGKYYIDAGKRTNNTGQIDSDNYVRIYVNKFTGMVSF
jgi:Tfp pilus assembly protein FimT